MPVSRDLGQEARKKKKPQKGVPFSLEPLPRPFRSPLGDGYRKRTVPLMGLG